MENSKEKVVIIGPVLPYRGGIAQHTTMLKRAMEQNNEVLMISFSRQYPAWLFPGESDKDSSFLNHKEPNTEYIIDSINPISWLTAIKRTIKFKPNYVVMPWWTVFWAPCFGFISNILKRNKIDVIFFCHNVVEHEAASWKNFLTKNVLKNATRYVVHTKEDRDNLINLLPQANVQIHPHPIYDQFPEAKGKYKRRKVLEILFYGFVRPYKGLDDLIAAMELLKGKSIQLTIAGEFWKGKEDTQKKINELGLSDQIELRPRYHTDQETAELFARADVVVLPYRSATGSGVVPIAYHYNKPVIVTNVGGLPDVVNDKKTGYIVEVGNVKMLAELIQSLSAESCKDMVPEIAQIKKVLSWSNLAETLAKE